MMMVSNMYVSLQTLGKRTHFEEHIVQMDSNGWFHHHLCQEEHVGALGKVPRENILKIFPHLAL